MPNATAPEMTTGASKPWPVELRVDKPKTILTIAYDDGETFRLPAEYLRVESPSAEVQGHAPDQKILVTGKEHVKIVALEPVGNYAVRIVFDDGHDTGLFSWDYLAELGREQAARWQAYLKAKRALH
jgi:DUF971 family protein